MLFEGSETWFGEDVGMSSSVAAVYIYADAIFA